MRRYVQDLRMVGGNERDDAFDFQNHRIGNQDICPKPERNRGSFIHDRDADLASEPNAGPFKFLAQTCFINGFQKPRPDRPMHLDRLADNPFRQPVVLQHICSPWASRPPVTLRTKDDQMLNRHGIFSRKNQRPAPAPPPPPSALQAGSSAPRRPIS